MTWHSQAIKKQKEQAMSIQKKSLISNRSASKKANLTKVRATSVSSTKLGSKFAVSAAPPRLGTKVAVSMVAPKLG
jgi:hypothetical protein